MKYILVIIMLTFVACNNADKKVTDEEIKDNETEVVLTDAQYKNASITTGKAEMRNLKFTINVKGKIDVPPQNMVSVGFPLGGYLKSTKLMAGMHVKKGEVIAVMEDQQYIQLQQEYLAAKVKGEYLEQEYTRQQELNKSKAASDKIYQQAMADNRSNKILISSLYQKLLLIGINPDRLTETNISRTVNILAPINGYVSTVNVNIGKYITPADVMFDLVNPEDIHLVLTVFEKDIDKLSIGQKLVAYTNNNPDKKYPCEIILIGKDVGEDRAIQVHCHFDSYDKALVPGMYISADIETSATNTYVVPEDAIVNYDNKQYIFIVVRDRQYAMREIVTGNVDAGFVAITDAKGLDLTSVNVVTHNAYTLLMKLKNKSE